MYYFLEMEKKLCFDNHQKLSKNFCDCFFKENNSEINQLRQRRNFLKTCKKICELGCYQFILSLITVVFENPEVYDIEMLGKTLNNVKITDGYSLQDLCSDFYKELITASPEDFENGVEEANHILNVANLFDNQITLPRLQNSYCRPHMEAALHVICSKIYTKSNINPTDITKKDIDSLVVSIRNEEESIFNKEIADIKARRLVQEEREKKKGSPLILGKVVVPKFTDDIRDKKLPGILSLVFTFLEVTNKNDLCFYILSEYVFPYFVKYAWIDGDETSECFAIILKIYSDLLFAVLRNNDSPLTKLSTLSEENLCKSISDEPGEDLVKYAKKSKSSLVLWAKILHRSKKFIKPVLEDDNYDYYSSHIASTAYLLTLADEYTISSQLLIDHYNDIKTHNKDFHYSTVALVKNILYSEDLNTANTLYGYFCSGEATYKREYQLMRDLINEILFFLQEAESYIKENDQLYTVNSRRVYDILYADDRIKSVEDSLSECYKINTIPDKNLCQKLSNILLGFGTPEGIALGKFADRNNPYELCMLRDTSEEYIEDGLSVSLRRTAERLYKETERFTHIHNITIIKNFHQAFDLLIQNKLIEMRKKAILQSTTEFSRIRNLEKDSDTITEMIITETERLVSMFKPNVYDRKVTEKLINESHDKFCNEQYPGEKKDLFSTLPDHLRIEIWNYLVTAEMIFRYLKEQNDPDLDYTPALISLTKALEFVLFEAYKKFDISDLNVDADIKKFTLDKNNNKCSHLELGNLIYLLKDGSRISLDKSNRTVFYNKNSCYSTSHFDKWNNGVFNISELAKFTKLDIIVTDYQKDKEPFAVHFSPKGKLDSEKTNRAILARTLEHIKETYRNPAAHKDKMKETAVESCRKLMLETEQILWILLAIIDFS